MLRPHGGGDAGGAGAVRVEVQLQVAVIAEQVLGGGEAGELPRDDLDVAVGVEGLASSRGTFTQPGTSLSCRRSRPTR